MKNPSRLPLITCVLALGALACNGAGGQGRTASDSAAHRSTSLDAGWSGYWNQGKGEITRYALDQARYGEIRHGDAVLIFVTEDFLGDKQVKLESDPAGKNVVPVLKLNMVKKFTTGIYPYSMMTSAFTPVDIDASPHALKVATTSQEWCGMTFTQLNFRANKYDLETRSYFESEGDQERPLDVALLEDEVWARIRRAPGSLPTGEIRVIPGTMSARLRHIPLAVETATATMTSAGRDSSGADLMRYTIAYKGSKSGEERTLAIDFWKTFPFTIVGWTETYMDGFGPKAAMLTTRAVRTNSMMLDYWKHNATSDDSLRRELGMP
jgi:hypothetical protein